MKPVKTLFIFIMVSALFTACISQQSVTQQAPAVEKPRIEAPPRYVLDINDAADDVKIVLAALANKMKGDLEQIDGVIFDDNGDHRIRETDFLNQGFALNVIDISGYQTEKISKNKAKAFIEGYFQFRDFIGRMASFYFVATYSQDPKIITIHSSAAIPMPSISPVLKTYFVPRSVFDEMPMEEFTSFTDLYLFTLLYAVPMMPTEAEKQEYEARKNTSFMNRLKSGLAGKSTDDYYILVFCMSQISPESSLEMTISNTPGLGGKSLAEPVYLYWDNWRVLIAGGHFDPHSDRDTFYANVAYNFDPSSGTQPVLVGSFANRKSFGPERPRTLNVHVITREPVTITPTDSGLGPLESGYIFLDPSRKADAVAIQKQLAGMGYYKMKVDGSFGKDSRSALKKFKTEYHLDNDDYWDINTQKALFKNSGL